MSDQGDLRTVAGKAVADPEFRQKLLDDPEAAVKEAGIELSGDQMKALKEMDKEQFKLGLSELDERLTGNQEHLRVLLLDTRNHVLDIVEVYRGSVNSSQVRVGEVFKAAVRRGSTAVIIVHNHPSGDPTPSPDDVAVTRAFVQAGKLLDVEVLDHLVIGQGKWVSLIERGLGFN